MGCNILKFPDKCDQLTINSTNPSSDFSSVQRRVCQSQSQSLDYDYMYMHDERQSLYPFDDLKIEKYINHALQ